MRTSQYLKMFKTEKAAFDWMRMKNNACRLAGNYRELFVVVEGPENDWSVMDSKSAIETGFSYTWA